jgi:DNA-binding transcriptional regulator YiaG
VSNAGKIATLPVPARRQAAALFRRARLAAGLSQEAAALLCGVGVRTLRDWELGRVRMTQLEALVVLDAAANDNAKKAA